MSCFASQLAIFAQLTHWQRLGDGVRSSNNRIELIDLLPYVLIAAAIGGGIAAYTAWKRQHDFSQRCDDPYKLFRELCTIHELDRGSQSLLKQLADALEFKQPAQVFLSPSAFAKPGLPEPLHAKAEHFAALRKRLF